MPYFGAFRRLLDRRVLPPDAIIDGHIRQKKAMQQRHSDEMAERERVSRRVIATRVQPIIDRMNARGIDARLNLSWSNRRERLTGWISVYDLGKQEGRWRMELTPPDRGKPELIIDWADNFRVGYNLNERKDIAELTHALAGRLVSRVCVP